MATTIHHMAYVMSADTAKFREGMTASRGELRQSKKIMEQTKGPVDRLEDELAELHKLYGKGLITTGAYNKKKRELAKSIKGAKKAGQGFTRFLKTGFKAGLVGSIGLVASMASGLGVLAKKMLDQFDPLDKLAKKSDEIGIPPGMLQRLRAAIELSSDFDGEQVGDAMERMTIRISEAAQGTGTAVDALKELGLSAVELNELRPDQQFLRIADAMRQVSNEGDQTRLTTELINRRSAALVNTLRMGSEEILSSSEHIQTFNRDQLSLIEQSNDAWTVLQQTMAGIFQKGAVKLAPMMEAMANSLSDMADNPFFNDMLDVIVEISRVGLPILVAGMHNLMGLFQTGVEHLMRMRAAFLDMAGRTNDAEIVQQMADVQGQAAFLSFKKGDVNFQRLQMERSIEESEKRAEERANQIRERQAAAAERTAELLEQQANQTPPETTGPMVDAGTY